MTENTNIQSTNTNGPKKYGAIISAYYIIGAIVFLFASYHGLNYYIDTLIERKVNDADFLKKLAISVRPSLIFDDKGSIIGDMGAVSFIKSISVSKGEKDSYEIIISPHKFLASEPILEALDDRYVIQAERGNNLDWIFHLSAIQSILWTESAQIKKQRFRLEIIR